MIINDFCLFYCSQGKGRFDVVRSFIATRSGLFRWHDHQENKDTEDEP